MIKRKHKNVAQEEGAFHRSGEQAARPRQTGSIPVPHSVGQQRPEALAALPPHWNWEEGSSEGGGSRFPRTGRTRTSPG